ncbi:MAG: hypothetical protein WCF36_00725 [Candidatus Nanopelagicales bacterium]
MLELARALAGSCRSLIPGGRHRWQLLALVMVGAAIPLTELMVAKIFTEIITKERVSELTHLAPQLALFVLLFLATRVAHYAQRTYRVTFFEAVFRSSDRTHPPHIESWQWALGLELVNVLTSLTQMLAMAAYFVVLAPMFGMVNLLLVAVLAEALGRLFTRQQAKQRSYVELGRAKEHVATHLRVRSRVVSAEVGGLISSLGALTLLIALLAMSINDLISASTTIVLFLGLRLQNSTFSTLSGGVMRFARARANSY